MINKEIFNNGISKLVTEYSGKGFAMSRERSEQWYEYLSPLTKDDEFAKAIDYVLKSMTYPPAMADILNAIKDVRPKYRDMTNYEPGE